MKWLGQNEDRDIDVEIIEEECHVCAAIERRKRQDSKREGEGATDGLTYNHDVFTYSGVDLDEFRDPFYEERLKRREEVLETRPHIAREHPVGWVDPDDD